LAQSFNAVGAALVPTLGAAFILSGIEYAPAQKAAMTPTQLQAYVASETNMVRVPYLAITAIFLFVAALIYFAHLPEVQERESGTSGNNSATNAGSVFAYPHLVKGVVAQFFYVGAQVGVGSFAIRFAKHVMPGTLDGMSAWGANFVARSHGALNFLAHIVPTTPEKMAALFLVAHQTGFMIGRFAGSWMMKTIPAPRLLAVFGFGALVCVSAGIGAPGLTSVLAIVLVGFFNSIMFPTIFALSLKNLGALTKRGSSLLVMSIVGGAMIPAAMGRISDASSIRVALVMPLICYLYVIYYAVSGYKPRAATAVSQSVATAEAK
jgi:FHS family L-fucose permease-like MFS transporter